VGTDRVVTSNGLTHRIETSEKSWGSLFPADEEREINGSRKARQGRFCRSQRNLESPVLAELADYGKLPKCVLVFPQ
jgi:hypothetical protein